MKNHVCNVCGLIIIDGVIPENCPVCHAPKTAFVEKTDLKTAKDIATKGESEKKHIPSLLVVNECGLIPGTGCIDVHVKVGEIPHPMTAEHYIMKIDLYIDKKFVARMGFAPGAAVNAAAALHVKSGAGKVVTAIETCNLHGAWMNEVSIA